MIKGDHGSVVGGPASHPECSGVRQVGHLTQPGAFHAEHLGGNPARGPVHPGVGLIHERRTRRFDFGETALLGSQVRLGGHNVGVGEFHGVFHPAFGCRISLTGQHRNTVEAAERDGLAVAPATCPVVTVFSLSVST